MFTPKFLYDFGISQDDPETELRALHLRPGDRVLCIASGGEVPLELLVNSDATVEIDAVDISGVQLYLSNLKLQAALNLDGPEAAEFLGYLPATRAERKARFEQLKSILSYGEVQFWNDHPEIFERGPIHYGRYETYIARFAPLGRWLLGGKKKLMGLFECRGIEQQQQYFDRVLRSNLLKLLFRMMFSRRLYKNRGVSERGLIHMADASAGIRFFRKFKGFCTNTEARTNWYLQFMLFGRILFEEALPAYLTDRGREKLKSEQHRLQFIKKSYTEMITESPAGHYNKFALSNVSDWLSVGEMTDLMKLIGEKAGPDARGLLRFLHSSGISDQALSGNINTVSQAGEKLLREDRFPFYNLIPFEVKRKTGAPQLKKDHSEPLKFETRELGPEWNEKLLQIARESPVESNGFRILFDRSPDIFTIPGLTSYSFRCGGLFEGDKLLGYGISALQKRYIGKGEVAKVMYLGNMHVSGDERSKGFYYRTSDFFFGHLPPEIEYCYAYIMEENRSALKFVNRRHPRFPGIPYSMVIGQITMVNILLSVPVASSRRYAVRSANTGDIDQIVGLLQKEHARRLLAPEMNPEIFRKNLEMRPHFGIENYYVAETGNEIVGVCAAWDMTSFKKSRVLDYGKKMGTVRWVYNTAAELLKYAQLPAPGEALREVTIAEYAVKERDPAILEALLQYCYRRFRRKGYHTMIFGSSVDDPLLKATRSFFSKEIRSNVVLSAHEWDRLRQKEGTPLLYADAIQI